MTGDKCPICNEIEGWEHVIRYQGIDHLKEAYLIDLEETIKKVKEVNSEWETISHILDYIGKYIQNTEEEFVTT